MTYVYSRLIGVLVNNATATSDLPTAASAADLSLTKGHSRTLWVCGPKTGTWAGTVTIYTTPDKKGWENVALKTYSVDQSNPTISEDIITARSFFGAAFSLDSGSLGSADADGRTGVSVFVEG